MTIKNNYSSAEVLADKFRGIPAIVASAGPSLEKHFKLLEDIKDRAVIVAPGSTTRILNKRGINAHIAMSIDSNIIQAGFYKEYTLNSILVASYRLHPETYNNFPNVIFCAMLDTEYLTSYYYYWRKLKPFIIGDHPSVAMAAVDMCFLMGCSPIILIGQDLSFHDNRNYADAKINSLSNYEINTMIQDVDIYGNPIYTNYGYKAMQHDMEMLNNKYKSKVNIYNATEGGLNIHGINNVKFNDIYNEFISNRKHDVAERLNEIVINCNVTNENGISNSKTEIDYSALFCEHLLDACSQTENLLNEKETVFIQLAKLIDRGVSTNRINNKMSFIKSYNKSLNDIPFYKQVVFPNIEPSLTYLRAGSKHIAEDGDEWEGSVVFEKKLDEYAMDFINVFKALLLHEMVSLNG